MFWRSAAPFGFPAPSSSAAVERLFARFKVPYGSPSPEPVPGEGDGEGDEEGVGEGEVGEGEGIGQGEVTTSGGQATMEEAKKLALLDALLESEQADVLNECKARSRPLLSLLSSPSVLARLLEYATGRAFDSPPITPPAPPPGNDDEEDDEDDLERLRDRIRRQERGETAENGSGDEKGWDAKRRSKFPTLSTELIALEDPLLLDALATSPALLPFWNWISAFKPSLLEPPAADAEEEIKEIWDDTVKEEGLWVSYWARIASVLIGGRRGAEFLNLILPTLPTLLPALMPLVPLFPPLSDLLTRLLASFPAPSTAYTQLLDALSQAKFVSRLVDMMKPENGTEAHAAASQLVLDMIGVAYGPVEGEVETVFGGGALMKELKDESSIARLVTHMIPPTTLDSSSPIPISYYSSSLTNGINILIELIRRYSSDIEAAEVAHQQHHVAASMDPQGAMREHPITEAQIRELATDLDGLLRVVSEHVGEWAGVLEHGMRVPLPVAGNEGQVVANGPLLGAERLRVCELFAEVLHLQYLYASSPLFEVLVEGSVFLDEEEEVVERFGQVSLESGQGSGSGSGLDRVKEEEEQGLARSTSTTSVIQELHSLSRSIAKHRVLPRCISLFFLYPWNNFLHSVVYDMVAKVFNTFAYVAGVVGGTLGHGSEGSPEGPRNEIVENRMRRMRDGVGELVVSIVKDGQLMEKIVEAQNKNDRIVTQPKGSRLGYMGHLTHVADECLKLWEKCSSDLPLSLHTSFLSSAWIDYANGTLRETRDRDRQPLGGARPNAMAIGLGMQGDDEGRNNGVTVAFGNATLDPGADGDLRGWTGPAGSGVVGLGAAEDDDDEDGNTSKFAAYLSQKAGALPAPIAGTADSDDEDRSTDSEGEEDLVSREARGAGAEGYSGVASGIQGWYTAEQTSSSPTKTQVRRVSSHGLDDPDYDDDPLSVKVSDDVEIFHDASTGLSTAGFGNSASADNVNFFANFDATPTSFTTDAADPLESVSKSVSVSSSGESSPNPAGKAEDWADFNDAPGPR